MDSPNDPVPPGTVLYLGRPARPRYRAFAVTTRDELIATNNGHGVTLAEVVSGLASGHYSSSQRGCPGLVGDAAVWEGDALVAVVQPRGGGESDVTYFGPAPAPSL